MSARSGLERLFRPRSIAVIGGGVWCQSVIEQCERMGFSGSIWPVHPKRDEIAGLTAFQTVQDLPAAPDATFIGINRDATIAAVEELARRGAGGAVCFASGFREAQAETGDGAAKQDTLLASAGEMRILGPNCYGFLNYLDGAALWPDQHGGVPVARGVAILTQSSNIALNLTMQARGLPLAYVVTVGNQAQTGMAEFAQALIADPRVTAIGLHIEGIGDLRAFEAMAQAARDAGKSIVALKVGASYQAQAATISHTASLAGSDAGARAFLKRIGIGQVTSLPALLETLKLLHVSGPLRSNRIASMSCSGGEASVMADAVLGTRLEFPPLTDAQTFALRDALGPQVALANPLDYHTYIWGDEDALTKAFGAMMQGDLAMGCVVLDFPRCDRCDAAAWERVIGAVRRTQKASGIQMAILSSLGENLPEDVADRLVELGIVPFYGITEAVEAMGVAATLGRPPALPEPILLPATLADTRLINEHDAKQALASAGVAIPRSTLCGGPRDAAEASARIGFPVALKGLGVAHKTEAGAVALNLKSRDEVEAAASAMPSHDFLVEQMVRDAVAELLIGVVLDPAHGYVLTLASGGILTELLEDRVSLLVPVSRETIRDALNGLKVSTLLKGYRGQPAADLDAILDAVEAVQRYVETARPAEVEINPLICTPDAAIAADALIRIGDPHD